MKRQGDLIEQIAATVGNFHLAFYKEKKGKAEKLKFLNTKNGCKRRIMPIWEAFLVGMNMDKMRTLLDTNSIQDHTHFFECIFTIEFNTRITQSGASSAPLFLLHTLKTVYRFLLDFKKIIN